MHAPVVAQEFSAKLYMLPCLNHPLVSTRVRLGLPRDPTAVQFSPTVAKLGTWEALSGLEACWQFREKDWAAAASSLFHI